MPCASNGPLQQVRICVSRTFQIWSENLQPQHIYCQSPNLAMNWQYSQIDSHISTLRMHCECICVTFKFGTVCHAGSCWTDDKVHFAMSIGVHCIASSSVWLTFSPEWKPVGVFMPNRVLQFRTMHMTRSHDKCDQRPAHGPMWPGYTTQELPHSFRRSGTPVYQHDFMLPDSQQSEAPHASYECMICDIITEVNF